VTAALALSIDASAARASLPAGFEVEVHTAPAEGTSHAWDVSVDARALRASGHGATASAWTSLGWRIDGPTAHHALEAADDGRLPAVHFRVVPDGETPDRLDVVVRLQGHPAAPPDVSRFAFRVSAGALLPISEEEEHDELLLEATDDSVVMRFQGTVFTDYVSGDGSLRRLELADIPETTRAAVERAMEERAGGIDTTVGAMTSPAPKEPGASMEAEGWGCGAAGHGVTAGGIVLLLLLLVGRSSRERRRRILRVLGLSLGVAAVPALAVATGASAQAEERCAWGFTGWWDGRSIEVTDTDPYVENSYPGFYRQPCDPDVTACFPWQSDCCFTELRGVRVRLLRKINGVPAAYVDTTVADYSTGFFMLCDPSWSPAYTYDVQIIFDHGASPPGSFRLIQWSGHPAPYGVSVHVGAITDWFTFVGLVSPNAAGDLTSFSEGLARAWAGASETLLAIEAQGETRHRRAYGSPNAYDTIPIRVTTMPCWVNGVSNCSFECSTSTVRVSLGANAVGHELGHALHLRVVGCAGFPKIGGNLNPHLIYHTSEGVSLFEGIATFVGAFAHFDPLVVQTEDFVTKAAPCDPVTHENDLVSQFNNVIALWDLVDADGGYTDSYADNAQVTLPTLFDALLTLRDTPGFPGQNRTGNEQLFTETSNQCAAPSTPYGPPDPACPPGQVCDLDGLCRGGKPHGSNLRDWVHHLPNGSWSPVYWQAMESSVCVGPDKDVPPFNGGYRLY